MTYSNIDMKKTGEKLKEYMEYVGVSVKELQEMLHLSCPQPIYRWIKGKVLPSVDHLLVLSEFFGVHMEELLVKNQAIPSSVSEEYNESLRINKRCFFYYKKVIQQVA